MRDENWNRAISAHYGYADLGALQNTWLDWVKKGSPALERTPATGEALAAADPRSRPEPNLIYRGQNGPLDFTPAANPNDAALAGIGPTASAMAANNPAAGARPRGADGWHVPGAKAALASDVAVSETTGFGPANSGDVGHQMTRPPGAQPARQIILEWSKSQATGTVQVPGPPQASAAPPTNASSESMQVAGGTASVYGNALR
jgi:hypothetical protein